MMEWNTFNLIEIALTTHCNANCPLCARTDRTTGKKKELLPLIHYDLDKLKNLIDQLQSDKKIYFCGDYGDPMMYPYIEQAIDYAISKNFTVMIDTNGGIRDENFYKKIASKYGQKLIIYFSIDGFDQKTNEIYRVDVDFEKAKNNCTIFAEHCSYGNCVWQMLIFNHNYHQIDDIANYCKKNKIIFDFKLNVRTWKYKKVTNEIIINYVRNKQQEYCNLL